MFFKIADADATGLTNAEAGHLNPVPHNINAIKFDVVHVASH
jgi:hypothetical protein